MPRPTTVDKAIPVRVAIVTLDSHLASATDRARQILKRDLPGLTLDLHSVSEWGNDPEALERARTDIEKADIIVAAMLFMEDHIQAVLPSFSGPPKRAARSPRATRRPTASANKRARPAT